MSNRPLRIGLMVSAGEDPFGGQLPVWKDIAAFCRQAEDIGVDSLYVGDHLQMNFGPGAVHNLWDQPTILAGLATCTSRVGIGLLMACTAFRNPTLLAKMALTIDDMSGGRLTLGLGAGWHDPEFVAFGYPTDFRVSRFAEAIQIISALIRTGECDMAGRWYQCRELDLRPLLTNHRIPIIASGKGTRMLRLVAEYADGWNRDFGPEGSIAELPAWQSRVDEACLDVGRDPESLTRSAAVAIAFPSIQEIPPGFDPLRGTTDDIAAAIAAYATAGYEEVVCWIAPSSESGLNSLAQVLEVLDN